MKITIDTEENKLNDIERQLHEQYAINNNSKLGTVVSLMVGLFVVIGFYGKVFMESSYFFESTENDVYSLGDLCIAAICAYIALGIMAYICIYQGIYQRCEQFIVWSIRKKFYGNYNNPKIFPNNYVPFGKKGIDIIQGLYGEFVYIISYVARIVLFSLLFKIVLNIIELHNFDTCNFSWFGFILCFITLTLHILSCYICNVCFNEGVEKYIMLSKEYEQNVVAETIPCRKILAYIVKPTIISMLKKVVLCLIHRK